MATLHVAGTGADRSLEKQGWKSPRLPEIVHPMQRAEDRSTLAVQGLSSRRSINRDAHGGLNLDASSRPATCPENNFGRGTSRTCNSRPATSLGPSTSGVHLGVDEVLYTAGIFPVLSHLAVNVVPSGNLSDYTIFFSTYPAIKADERETPWRHIFCFQARLQVI